jgi:hypothetical protein
MSMTYVAAAPKTIAFDGKIGSIANGAVDVSLASGTSCTVQSDALPYKVDCDVILAVGAKNGKEVRAELHGGLRLDAINNAFQATALYQAVLPKPKLDGTFDSVTIPATQGTYTYSGPTLTSLPDTCLSQVVDNASDSAASELLKLAAAVTGSNVCVAFTVNADNTSGAAASLVLKLDVLNADLIEKMVKDLKLPGDVAEQISIAAGKSAVTIAKKSLNFDPIHQEIDVGKAIVELLRNKAKTTAGSRLRRYLASDDASASIVSDDGKFLFGSAATGSSNYPLIFGAAGGVVLLGAGVAVFIARRRVTKV